MYDRLEPAFNIIISLHLHKSRNEPKSIFKVHPMSPYHTLRNQVRLICSLLLLPSASQAACFSLASTLLYCSNSTVQQKQNNIYCFHNKLSLPLQTALVSLVACCQLLQLQNSDQCCTHHNTITPLSYTIRIHIKYNVYAINKYKCTLSVTID